MNKQAVFVVGIVLAILAAGAFVYSLIQPNRMELDPVTWQAMGSEADYEKRVAMLDSVLTKIREHQIVDRETAKVLLGPSDKGIPEFESRWIYLLTPERSVSTENRYLELNFDAAGKIISSQVREKNDEVAPQSTESDGGLKSGGAESR